MTDEPTLRVVIVDDEPLARAVVREYLRRAARASRSSPSARNGFEAVKAVTRAARPT